MNKLRDKKVIIKFGQRLRDIRIKRGLTLEDLAYNADMEISQIYRIEKGLINPTLTTLSALSKALKISLSELLDFNL